MKKVLKKAFLSSIPVLTGYLVLGFGFGIILKSYNYGILIAFVMSFLIYAGSMQYVAIGLMTGGASLLTVALTTLMVNARHLFYGISMLEKYKNVGKRKPYLIFSLTDETYSLVCSDNKEIEDKYKKDYYLFVSIFNHSYWIIGTIIGVLIGTFINFNSEGIDFALTALFITVFLEQWLSSKNHKPALIGVIVSIICLIVFGKDGFLIPTMIVITIILLLFKEKNNG